MQRVVKKGAEPKARTALIFTGPFEYTRQNRYYLSALAELLNIKLREALRENLGGTYGVTVSPSASEDPEPVLPVHHRLRIGARASGGFDGGGIRSDRQRQDGLGRRRSISTKVKEAALRSRETAIKQNGYWLAQISTFDQSGWPLEDIPNGDKLISTLTSDDLSNAAIKYLRTDNYVRVSLYPENFPAADNR